MYTFAQKLVVLHTIIWHSSLPAKIAKHKYYPLGSHRCPGSHHSNQLKCMISIIILTSSITLLLFVTILQKIKTIWEQLNNYNQKQNKDLSFNMEKMDFLPPNSPNLVFECYRNYISSIEFSSNFLCRKCIYIIVNTLF